MAILFFIIIMIILLVECRMAMKNWFSIYIFLQMRNRQLYKDLRKNKNNILRAFGKNAGSNILLTLYY